MKEKLLTLPTVREQLIKLLNHFPSSGRTLSSLEIVAPDYLKEFEYLSEEGFVGIVNDHINKNRFFPTIADLHEFDLLEYVMANMKKKNS